MGQGQGSITNNQKQQSGGIIPPTTVIGAQNGLNATVTPNIAELGGVLIRDTDIGGALFKLGFINANVGVGVAAAAIASPVKFHAQQTIAFGTPANGTTTGLFQGIYVPNAPIPSVNFYALVGTTSIDLSTSTVTGANTFNATGILGSLVIVGNNGTSSVRRLRATMSGVVLNGNVLVNEIAGIEIRQPEISGSNVVTNMYGLYINQQNVTGVTNSYGVYQASALDNNLFTGSILADGGLRVRGANTAAGLAASGIALNISISGGTTGLIQAFNSTTFNYFPLGFSASDFSFDVGGSIAFVIDTNKAISGRFIHNNAALPTGTTTQYLASGTYTPTLFNTTNIAASTPYQCQWIRCGNVVTVSGKVDIDATAAAVTLLGMSLPIPSTMIAEQNLGGIAATNTAVQDAVRILSDFANGRASFSYTAISLANISYNFTFTYLIL